MLKCDTARISSPCGHHYLIIGHNRNTKTERDAEWVNEKGEVIHFDFVEEHCVASGETEEELIKSAKTYVRHCKMSWGQYIEENWGVKLPKNNPLWKKNEEKFNFSV